MNQSVARKIYALTMFLAVSVVCGLLTAGLLVPYVALSGGVAKAAGDGLDNLPEELAIPEQAQRSEMLLSNNAQLAQFYEQNREYVPLGKINLTMQKAQIGIEDHRFYEHGAIDLVGTMRAFATNATSGDTQGGSTLSQQYIKQVLVQNATVNGDSEAAAKAQEATVARKVRELRYAIALEKKFSKKEILERYLNIAYYADGQYGVEAAAKHYFGIPAIKLNWAQSAFLAGLVQNPTATDPVHYPQAAVNRRNVVLNRLESLKFMTPAEHDAAKKVPFDKNKIKPRTQGCTAASISMICEYVWNLLRQMPSLGKTPKERENLVKQGGLRIKLSLDPNVQAGAQAAVSKVVTPTDEVVGGTVLIDPPTGRIISMAQSRPTLGEDKKKGQTYINYNVARPQGGGDGYQAGSTFKMFAIAAALADGRTENQRYKASKEINFGGQTFSGCDGKFTLVGDWKVTNSVPGYDDRDINMVQAAQGSVNTYFVQLARDLGGCKITTMAEKLGVQLGDGKSPRTMSGIPSFVLGSADVTPLSVAQAYATIANQGVHCSPTIIESITTKNGKKSFPVPRADCKRVISKDVANGVTRILSQVMVRPGTGARAAIPGVPLSAQAGKTGTTDSNKAVWFAGYTPNLAGISMISLAKGETKEDSLKGYTTKAGIELQGSGSGDAGIIYKAAMQAGLKGKPDTPFGQPSDEILKGRSETVPETSNMSPQEAQQAISAKGFATQIVRTASTSVPEGYYMGSSPAGGQQARLSDTVNILVSSGPPAQPKVNPSSPPDKKPGQDQPAQPPAQPSASSSAKPKPGGPGRGPNKP